MWWLLLGIGGAQTCVPTRVLHCGDRVFDEQVPAGVNAISGYQCVDSSMDQGLGAGEQVYELAVGEAPVTVALKNTYNNQFYGDWYYEVVVLEGACSADACLATSVGRDQLTFVPDPGVTYFVVVEETSPGAVFDLEISCLPEPGAGDDTQAEASSGGCSGSAAAWLFLPLVFGRRRRTGSTRVSPAG